MPVPLRFLRLYLSILAAVFTVGFSVSAQEVQSSKPAKDKPRSRTDRYGDPLPPGALARIGTVRLRHGSEVDCLTFSPDGKTLASASADGTFRRWDAATGKELWRFEESLANAVAFSPDGRTLAGITYRQIRLWDATTGREKFRIRHLGLPRENPLAFSPDGKVLAAARRSDIRLCDTTTGKEIRQPLKGDQNAFLSLSFSADGKKLISAGGDKTVRIWNVATGKELYRLEGHTDKVHSAALSPDGQLLVTGSEDKTTRLWDMASGKELRRMAQPGAVLDVVFSRDGKTLAIGGPNPGDAANYGLLQLWDTTPEIKPRRRIPIPYGVGHIALSPDGRTLAATQGNSIRLWDVITGKEKRLNEEPDGRINSLAVSPDGGTVAVGGGGESIRLCDIATGRVIRRFSLDPDTPHVQGVAFSPDGKKLASASIHFGETAIQPRGFDLWDLSSGERTRRAPDEIVYRLAFSPDGKRLATGHKEIKLWDAANGKELRRLPGTPAGWGLLNLNSLTFSTDGKFLAVLEAGNVVLWDVAEGKEVRTLSLSDRKFHALALSPPGNLLATASFTSKDRITVHLWDVAEGVERQRIQTLHGLTANSQIAFTPDGRALAVGFGAQSSDRDRKFWVYTVQLWETATGKMRCEWKGHSGWIWTIAFSSDGKRLLSGGDDTSVLIWDVLGHFAAGSSGAISSEQLQALWADLANEDAARAFNAIGLLALSSEKAIPLLKEKLRPAPPSVEPRQFARLIAELDSDEFAVREKAREQLRQLGERAEPGLREALKGKLSLEVRKRIEELLESVRALAVSPDNLRNLRAVEVLEHIGTPDARQVLKTLAEGAVHARLTREARAALERLAKRRLVSSGQS